MAVVGAADMQGSCCLDDGLAARVMDRNVDLFDGSNKASAHPVTCTYLYREGVSWQGLQPCTCRINVNGRSNGNS